MTIDEHGRHFRTNAFPILKKNHSSAETETFFSFIVPIFNSHPSFVRLSEAGDMNILAAIIVSAK